MSEASAIYVTHFQSALPAEEYSLLMAQRMRAGLSVTRILPREPDPPTAAWLEQFDEFRDHVDGIYREVHVTTLLPFDVLIFDEAAIAFNMPQEASSHRYDEHLVFADPLVARRFKTCLERLIWLDRDTASV